jgi:hypothetical protein
MIRPTDENRSNEIESTETDEDGRIGIFPSWRALYISVLLYTLALIVLLYILTKLLNHSDI